MTNFRLSLICLAFATSSVLGLSAADSPPPATPAPTPQAANFASTIPSLNKKVDFEADVLPILKRNCLACHNETDAEGELVLETPKSIMKGGEKGVVVVPRDPGKSRLLKSAAQVTKPLMPPKNNKVGAEPLKPDELALLKTWIEQGATGTVNAKPKPVQWRPLPPGLHPILALAVTGDGQFAACGRANQIFIYHIPTGQIVTRLIDPKLTDKPNRSGYKSAAERDFVQSLAFSPDGKTLASGEYRIVKLWKREENSFQFTMGADAANAIAGSPDGKWLATAGKDFIIRIWDAATGKLVKALPGHSATVNSLRFSPDNTKLASGGADKSLRIWDIGAGKNFSKSEVPQEISAVAWVMGGKQIASAGGETVIRLWEPPAQAEGELKQLKELPGHAQPVTCMESFPADGKQLVSGSRDGAVIHWNIEQRKQVRKVDQGAPVTSLAVSPNGKTFASVGGNSGKLWSVEKGQQIGEMKGDPAAKAKAAKTAQAVTFAKNEIAYWKTILEDAIKAQPAKNDAVKKATDALAAADKAIGERKSFFDKVTDPKAKPDALDAVKKAESAKVSADKALKAAQLSAKQTDQAVTDAKAASEKAAVALKKAEADAEQAAKALPATETPIRAVAFAPDNLTVSTAGDDQMVRTWSAVDGAGFDVYPGKSGPVNALAYTADGRLFSATKEGGAVVWRTAANWTLLRSIGTGDEKSPLINRVLALDFSSDGQLLATGGGAPSRNGEVKLWRPADGTLVKEIKPSHSDTVFSLAFSPDGKSLATASADKFVKIFDVASGKVIKTLSGHTHYVLGVGWRADGRTLASSGTDMAVKLWSFPAGEQTKNIIGFNKEVTTVKFMGIGGEMIASTGDSRVRILKEDGTTGKEMSGGKGFIFSTAITPDGQTVLGGGQDSVLRIWNTASGKILSSLEPPPVEIAPKAAAKGTK